MRVEGERLSVKKNNNKTEGGEVQFQGLRHVGVGRRDRDWDRERRREREKVRERINVEYRFPRVYAHKLSRPRE